MHGGHIGHIGHIGRVIEATVMDEVWDSLGPDAAQAAKRSLVNIAHPRSKGTILYAMRNIDAARMHIRNYVLTCDRMPYSASIGRIRPPKPESI